MTIWASATQGLLIFPQKPFLGSPLVTHSELKFRLREVGGNQHSCQLPFFHYDLLVTGTKIIWRGVKELHRSRRKKPQLLKIEETINNITSIYHTVKWVNESSFNFTLLLLVGVISHHTSIFTNEFSTKKWCSYVGVTNIKQSICLNSLGSDGSATLGTPLWQRKVYTESFIAAVYIHVPAECKEIASSKQELTYLIDTFVILWILGTWSCQQAKSLGSIFQCNQELQHPATSGLPFNVRKPKASPCLCNYIAQLRVFATSFN